MGRPAATLLEGGMAVAIVGGALLRVFQHLIGFGDLLEHLLGVLVALVLVGMILNGFLPVSLFQLLFGGVLLNAEQFVIVVFGHVIRL